VESASGGTVALETLRKAASEGAPFEIALLDMNMPEMDGETLGRLVAGDPALAGIRLVMLTSVAMGGEGERVRSAGFDAYLTKPIKQEHLHRCLSALRRGNGPVRPAAPAASLITRTVLEASPRRQLRILVVEDNPTNQKVATAFLERDGCKVEVADDGREALRILASTAFDLILMDCQMPVMDGFETTRKLRSGESPVLDRTVPIIAMTASAMQGDKERCLAVGMDAYVSKPLVASQLTEVIDRILARPGQARPAGGTPTAAAPGGPARVLDGDALLSGLDGDTEIAITLLEGLLEDVPKRVEALQRALELGDAKAARREAHTLKGLAASGGAPILRDLAGALEETCDSGRLADAARGLPRLREAVSEVGPLWKKLLDECRERTPG
jgi:CheY-like chemotaxis protein/HPt (histidine-containing phosphotransfer) domain-containing protein